MIRHGWREGPLLSRRDPGATREKPRTSQSTISGETAGGEAAEAGHFGGNRAKRKKKKSTVCMSGNEGSGIKSQACFMSEQEVACVVSTCCG